MMRKHHFPLNELYIVTGIMFIFMATFIGLIVVKGMSVGKAALWTVGGFMALLVVLIILVAILNILEELRDRKKKSDKKKSDKE